MAKKKLSTAKQEEIRKKMMTFRMEAEEGNVSKFKRMTINERFKIGSGQWDHDDKTYNEANGKFCLTINEVLPIVLDIAGTQENNPLDYKVRNVKGGTQTIAEILSSLAKNVMDTSMGKEVSSRSFESGVTIAVGYLRLDIDYTNDPLNGDFDIIGDDPFMVLPDPTCKSYDYNAAKGGAKYIIVDEWIDKDKVKAENPGKDIEDANFSFTRATLFGRFRGIMGKMFGAGGPDMSLKDDYRFHGDDILDDENHASKQVNNSRVSTYWWKEWKKGVYLQRIDDPLNYLALTDKKDIADARRIVEQAPDQFKLIEKDRDENPLTVAVLNKTTMIGDKFLKHAEDPFNGINLYPIVRFAPYFDHGYEYPPVENLVGPQKLINYAFSTLVNTLKQLSNTGWITGKTTERKKEELEDFGNQDGIVLNKEDYGGTLEKIPQNEFPIGFDIITERSKQNMREISQVQLVQPVSGQKESGKAKQIDEIRTLRTKGIIFRNWNQTNVMFANLLIEMIRNTEIFSDDEIMAIIDEDDLIDPRIFEEAKQIVLNQIEQMGQQIPDQPEPPNPITARNATPELQAQLLEGFQTEMAAFQEFVEGVEAAATPIARDIMLRLLRKMQTGRYGIKVDTSPAAPTLRMIRGIEIRELNAALLEGGQPGVSRKQMVEATDVQNKDEIIADVPQVAQRVG